MESVQVWVLDEEYAAVFSNRWTTISLSISWSAHTVIHKADRRKRSKWNGTILLLMEKLQQASADLLWYRMMYTHTCMKSLLVGDLMIQCGWNFLPDPSPTYITPLCVTRHAQCTTTSHFWHPVCDLWRLAYKRLCSKPFQHSSCHGLPLREPTQHTNRIMLNAISEINADYTFEQTHALSHTSTGWSTGNVHPWQCWEQSGRTLLQTMRDIDVVDPKHGNVLAMPCTKKYS